MIDNRASNISKYLDNLDDSPGVYRMLDQKQSVLYIGKAKNLYKRVLQYTAFDKLSVRIQMMISSTKSMEFIHTQTEAEALILEAQLIKTLQPRYNIRLKDDKSYAYIAFSKNHKFPMIRKLRVNKKSEFNTTDYKLYGPFISGNCIDKTKIIIQKIFKLRTCSDMAFASAKRPCLQYYIKQCSAPCVNYINCTDYAANVSKSYRLLEGKIDEIAKQLQNKMLTESSKKNYESAAKCRDQIKAINTISNSSSILNKVLKSHNVLCHVMGVSCINNKSCIEVFIYKNRVNYGNKVFFPENCENLKEAEILEQFFKIFYLQQELPEYLIISHDISKESIENLKTLKNNIEITCPKIGNKKVLTDYAIHNAKLALIRNNKFISKELFVVFAEIFNISNAIKKIEIYDNSHISGTNGVCAMVSVGINGFIKNEYRKVNIKNINANDDCNSLKYMLQKRFGSDSFKNLTYPSVVVIDGGKAHLNIAINTINKFNLSDKVQLILSISKGEGRKDGLEKIHLTGNKSIDIKKLSADKLKQEIIEQFLINVRDEAHRFAIQGHRLIRSKEMVKSELDNIKGVGNIIKKRLMDKFISTDKIRSASIYQLSTVTGISKNLAKEIKLFLG